MPAPGKLGKNPYVHTLKTMRAALITAKALDALGVPPPTSPGYSALVDKLCAGDWGIDGNDQYGDCVFADWSHRLMIWTAQGSGTMVKATTAETLAAYSKATGFNPSDPSTDQGADIPTIASYAETNGITVGGKVYKSDGHGIIDPVNVDHRKWAINVFGCTPIGLNLPQSALDQFDAGQPWDVNGDATIVGGHDVLLIEYGTTEPAWQVVTWAKRWPVTTSFLNTYLSEVVPVVSHDFITASGTAPSGVNLVQMLADLKGLN